MKPISPRLVLLCLTVNAPIWAFANKSSCGASGGVIPGGRLVVPLRSEPKTLNPISALDAASRSVIGRMGADLIHIARDTQQTVPSLAESWSVSRDGRVYTLRLRRGVRFSDGHPFTADDVVFSFQVYLDERLRSSQRDLLIVGGSPIDVRKVDAHTIQVRLSQPYAAGERLFDSIVMLPSHLLRKGYESGRLGEAWNLGTAPTAIAGLGPFVLRSYVPGQRIVLGRNPNYWAVDKCGVKLPYLDEIVLVFAGSEDGQVIRFQAGEADVISRFSAGNFAVLNRDSEARGYELRDLGAGLEYHFLSFNLNDLKSKKLPHVQRKQKWFADPSFRRAISLAADRESIVRLVYHGRAAAIATHVTPGNRLWLNRNIAVPQRSIPKARQILSARGYSWRKDGTLLDPEQLPVEFTVLAGAGNPQRSQMAAIIQDDLKQLGMRVQIVSLESKAVMDRVFRTFDYDTAVMALAGGDADPNVEMNVWSSRGSTHLWNLTAREGGSIAPWEAEIDRLMDQQMISVSREKRKEAYDRVQELVSEYLPVVCLVSPNILVGAKKKVGNFRPAVLEDYVLWNAEELYLRQER